MSAPKAGGLHKGDQPASPRKSHPSPTRKGIKPHRESSKETQFIQKESTAPDLPQDEDQAADSDEDVEAILQRRGRPWLEDMSESSDEDADAVKQHLEYAEMDDPLLDELEIEADQTNKISVVNMAHKVYWEHEIDIDQDAALQSDETGTVGYLLACRRHGIRPNLAAILQASSPMMLLQHYGLQTPDAQPLAAMIASNNCLTDINLSNNLFGESAVALLAKALAGNETIETVTLRSVSAGWFGGEEMAKTLFVNQTITSLDLKSNKMGDRAVSDIAKAVQQNNSLTYLNLADNQVAIKGSVAIAQMLVHNTTLRTIDISWNHIRPQELRILCQSLMRNQTLKSLSMAWNGVGGKGGPNEGSDGFGGTRLASPVKSPQSPKSGSPRSKLALTGSHGSGDELTGGEALVGLIRKTQSITELDISNCRLSENLCRDLAEAIRENKTIHYLLMDGNPMGDDAVDILKELKARLLNGSIRKFSMDNCAFDPSRRQLEVDSHNPNGYYKLDLSDEKDTEICKLLISETKRRKTDAWRNEKLNNQRITLTYRFIHDSNDDKGWVPPTEGILEVDFCVVNHAEPGTSPMDPDDFRILTRVMENSSSDGGRLAMLKQACNAYYLDVSQALTILFKFARDSARENALVIMFAHLIDRKNLALCHAALSERSRFNLHKRIGPLYMMNRSDPAGRYWFDLFKRDDQRALRMLLQLKRNDPTGQVLDVHYTKEIGGLPVQIEPESETWSILLGSSGSETAMGTPESVATQGILELTYACARQGASALKLALMQAFEKKDAGKGPGIGVPWGGGPGVTGRKKDYPGDEEVGRRGSHGIARVTSKEGVTRAASKEGAAKGSRPEILVINSRPGTRDSGAETQQGL